MGITQLPGMQQVLRVLATHREPWKHYEGKFEGVLREENYSACCSSFPKPPQIQFLESPCEINCAAGPSRWNGPNRPNRQTLENRTSWIIFHCLGIQTRNVSKCSASNFTKMHELQCWILAVTFYRTVGNYKTLFSVVFRCTTLRGCGGGVCSFRQNCSQGQSQATGALMYIHIRRAQLVGLCFLFEADRKTPQKTFGFWSIFCWIEIILILGIFNIFA